MLFSLQFTDSYQGPYMSPQRWQWINLFSLSGLTTLVLGSMLFLLSRLITQIELLNNIKNGEQ